MTAAEALNHRWLGRASNVSTKNLFAVSTNATSAMDDPRITQSPAGDTAPACEPRGLKAQMMQYNVDRKVALPVSPLMFSLTLAEGRLYSVRPNASGA